MIAFPKSKPRVFIIGIAAALVIIVSLLHRHRFDGEVAAVVVSSNHPVLKKSSTSSTSTSTHGRLLNESAVLSLSHSHSHSDAPPPFPDKFPNKELVVDAWQLQMILYINSVDNKYNEKKLRKQIAVNGFNLEYVNVDKDGSEGGTFMIVTSLWRYFNTPIVVFRGSGNEDDFWTDEQTSLVDAKFVNAPSGVQIHKGSYDVMFGGKLVDDIDNKVVELLKGKTHGNVIVTGYSLGHSNGHIMSTYLADKYPSMKVQMIGFASPIVGNKTFKTWTEEELKNMSVWRYVYKNDIVPRLHIVHNLDLVGMEYHHAGHLINIDSDDDSTKAYYRQTGDSNKGFAGAPKKWYSPTSKFNTQEHLPSAYSSRFSTQNLGKDENWPTEFMKDSILSSE